MKSTIRLFKAVPIKTKIKKGQILSPSKEILEKTIKRGFVFAPEVIYNNSEKALLELIEFIEEEVGLTAEQMNSSFHKSWQKVRDASIEQLVLEQLIHYITTYGFERLGIYDKDSVYIPNEKLEIPELKEGITLVVIKGYTKEELKEKLLALLQTGIALSKDTIDDVTDVATYVELNETEIANIKNKEVKIALYDFLDLIPENPVEFLRYLIYKTISKTLLIKDKATIEEIKITKNLSINALFVKYKKQYGLKRLAEIFYRFKPIFLAFRTNTQLRTIVNKIRRLAKKYHKPMKVDYLNEVTAIIKKTDDLDLEKLEEALSKVNVFRKIRLAYALKFRTKDDISSILYKIRNGRGYATTFNFRNKATAQGILDVVLESIVKDIKPNVKGKKICIPEYVTYTLPATEKQFTGDFPSGTYVTIPRDMVFGVHWENVDHHRIDLDLSLMNATIGKIGWDSSYRTGDRSVLFSGDITDAPKPKGASELFYVKRQDMGTYILFVNYFNYDEKIEVPFKIVVAKEQITYFKSNYMLDPNNVVAISKTKINQQQKMLGLLVTTPDECRFYYAETNIGKGITSSETEFAEHSRKYLFDFYRNSISLNEVLELAGAKIVTDKVNCDIDLSPESLEKATIISLLK